MKVLITGASGFIGKELVKELLKEECIELTLPLRSSLPREWYCPQIEYVKIKDLNAPDIYKVWGRALQEIDVIVHLAARAHIMNDSVESPIQAFRQANVEATKKLAQCAVKNGVKRFIFLSSIKVNGEQTESGIPFTEESSEKPQDVYAQSKLEAEELLKKICDPSSMEFVILRPPLVYGRGAAGNLAKLNKWINKGIPLPFGTIYNKRSLISIENLSSLIKKCLNHPKAANQVFLVADRKPVSTTELINRLARSSGKKAKLFPFPSIVLKLLLKFFGKKNMADRLFGSLEVDTSKITNELNWAPPK